jgi:hypothetical protein
MLAYIVKQLALPFMRAWAVGKVARLIPRIDKLNEPQWIVLVAHHRCGELVFGGHKSILPLK